MQITCAMQDPPDLNPIRQFMVKNQITPEALDAPRTDFRKTKVCTPAADAGIAGEKFKSVVSGFQK